jgi:hypothetical protein
MVEREDESGTIYMEDPLDKENLPYYAKAYYLLGVLFYSGSGIKKDAGEAIRLLRVADKLGYENEDMPDETAEKLLCKIIEDSEKEDVCDTVDCYVEVREENDRGERYKVILHHADGTESATKLRGRSKFVYLLALLIAHEGRSVYGMTTTHFSFMHEDLADMASDLRVNTNSYEDWIDEFIYVEKPEAESMRKFEEFQTIGYCSLDSSRYSNALSGANRAIKDSCISSEEFETFKLRSTGGRSAVTTMSIDSSQIELPNSLMVYLDCLPSQNKISLHKPKLAKWLPIKE